MVAVSNQSSYPVLKIIIFDVSYTVPYQLLINELIHKIVEYFWFRYSSGLKCPEQENLLSSLSSFFVMC